MLGLAVHAPRLSELKNWASCRRASSAVEFALIAPVLILMFFAGLDVSRAVTASYRAAFVADTIGELVSRTDHTLSDSELTGFIQAAPLIDPDILSYGRQTANTNLSSLAYVAISSIKMADGCKKGRVNNLLCWGSSGAVAAVVFSRAIAGPTRPCGVQVAAPDTKAPSMTTLPTSVFGPENMVVVDTEIFFKPYLLSAALFPTSFKRSSYFRPRSVTQVSSNNNCAGF